MLGVAQLSTHEDDANDTTQPAQASLFGDVANTNAKPRVDPKRALLKFGVRRDVDDIPLVKPVQLGLGDADVDRAELARGVTDGEPLSERAILRIIEGSDASGHRRAEFNVEASECLEAFFHQAKLICGFELAVCMVFSMVSKAPTYLETCPEWIIKLLFIDEKELIFSTFYGLKDDRRPELGDSGDDSEDE